MHRTHKNCLHNNLFNNENSSNILIRIFVIKIFITINLIMAWKHEYIFLKYNWNLNISEILQGKILHVNNILELLLKYHFPMFMMSSILLQLESWNAREHINIQLLWAAAQLLGTNFQPWLPRGWVLLQRNEKVGSVQDYIL